MDILSNAIFGLFNRQKRFSFHLQLGFFRSMSMTARNRLFSYDGYIVHIWPAVQL